LLSEIIWDTVLIGLVNLVIYISPKYVEGLLSGAIRPKRIKPSTPNITKEKK